MTNARTTRRPPLPSCLPRRQGFTLFEAAITLILLASVFTLVGTVLVGATRRGRLADQRRLAQQAAHSVLLEVTSRPWDELESIENVPITEEFAAALDDARGTVQVDPVDATAARRVTVEITWTDWTGQTVAPTKLVTWVHREGRP